MAKISLRAYNREIETLIERGQSEEAIAHCKFILKTFPKHLDTYRLLGKAFLETQRYSEAADILQRILSVQPDDFVSQIGMSIIREDEGNLDAALFHMERAFEIQPSNAAIQDELRRLYGRRDGVEPPKLRLTRGALVRMYARGDLYRQAVAEARAALTEDNQRVDIQIILARMYFLMGQKAEAAEISSKLVAKLPYCFEANRILAEVLPETSRAEDAKIYQQHLLALDPYLGYLSETAPTINQVPDQVVTVDRLEWTPSLETAEQPAWANDLGISINTKEEPKAEDWMSPFSTPEEPAPVEPVKPVTADQMEEPASSTLFPTEENQTPETASDISEIPSWMSEAGWGISESGLGESVQEQEAAGGEIEAEIEVAPGEMPDWLKNLAPIEEKPVPEENEQEKLEWLSSILPDETAVQDQNSNVEVTQPAALSSNPESSTSELISPVNEDLPEWLRSNASSSEESTSPAQLSEEPLPEWLLEADEAQPTIQESVPEQEQEKIVVDFGQEQPSLQVSTAEVQQAPETTPPEATAVPDLSNMDDAMAWLESLAAKQGADEEALLTKPEERQEQPPEWVIATANEEEPSVPRGEASQGTPEAIEVEQISVPVEPEETAVPFVEEIPELPSEMESSPAEELAVEPDMETSHREDQDRAIEPEKSEEPEKSSTPEPLADGSVPGAAGEDMDAAFAWLESLAAKQGAESDSLLVSPEERLAAPPEWVKDQSSEVLESQVETPVSLDQETPEEPEILEESAAEEIAEMPDWLKNVEHNSELEPPSEQARAQAAMADETPAEEAPQIEIESAGWVQESSLIEGEAGSPHDQAPESPEEPTEPVFGKTRPLSEWLAEPAYEDISQKAEPEPVIHQEPDLPDWLQEAPRQPTGADAMEPDQTTETETPPLPEWLQNIEPEKVEVPLPGGTPVAAPMASPIKLDLNTEPGELLGLAQQALSAGHIDEALSAYNALVQKNERIEETVHDLKDALYRYPVESSIWQTLGDALIRANRVQDALDAYTKAEELLK